MSLAQLVRSSVQKAREQLGDLAISFTVQKKIGSVYYNGKNIPSYSNIPLTGAHDKFEDHEIDGDLVRVTDNKIMLFIDSNDQVPSTEDLIVEDTVIYHVLKCQPIFAGDKVVLAMVHARR